MTRAGEFADNRNKKVMLCPDSLKLSSLGFDIGADSLSVLLEQKLRELSNGIDSSRCNFIKAEESSASARQNAIHFCVGSETRRFHDKNATSELHMDSDHAQIFSSFSSTEPEAPRRIQVATSLNSYECCVLQTGNAVFVWQGSQSLVEQHRLAVKVAEIIKPGGPLTHAKEGTETSVFWSALGGKQSFDSKKTSHNIIRDPPLFAFSVNKGKFQVEEVYNFAQDDLLTEDVLILNTQAAVFVLGWSVG